MHSERTANKEITCDVLHAGPAISANILLGTCIECIMVFCPDPITADREQEHQALSCLAHIVVYVEHSQYQSVRARDMEQGARCNCGTRRGRGDEACLQLLLCHHACSTMITLSPRLEPLLDTL
jgi:hypothetical protein